MIYVFSNSKATLVIIQSDWDGIIIVANEDTIEIN